MNAKNNKRAAIYLRVSSTDQNYERQRVELMQLAKSLGYEDITVYEEKASAVLKADTREELTKLRNLKEGEVDRIFIWDITRLSRRSIDFINLVNEFSQKKICLHFKDKNIVTLDDDGTENVLTSLYLYILGVFAQLDAENLKSKMRSGKREALRKGKSYTYRPPYGYKLDNKYLVLDDELIPGTNKTKLDWVRTIFNMYIEGRSQTEVVDTLNANRIPSPRGKKWQKASIAQMLTNPAYKGKPVVTYKYKDKDGNIISTEEVPTSCPAIIDEATWNLAQEIRSKNRHDVDKTKVNKALLRGILKCGNCGCSYIVFDVSKYKVKQYVCADKLKGINTRIFCKNGGIKVDTIDSIVWDCIKDVYTYKRFQESYKAEKEANQEKLDNNLKQIENYNQDISAQLKEKRRLIKAYQEGILSLEDISSNLSGIENTINRLNGRIATLEGENLNLQSKLNQDFSSYKLPEKELTFEEKKAVFKEQIASARMYSFGKTKRVVNLVLNVGLVYNIVVTSTRHIDYFVVEDSIAHFDTDCLKEGWKGDLFTIHDKNQVLFKDGTSGGFDYDGMWEVMKKHNLIVNIQ